MAVSILKDVCCLHVLFHVQVGMRLQAYPLTIGSVVLRHPHLDDCSVTYMLEVEGHYRNFTEDYEGCKAETKVG